MKSEISRGIKIKTVIAVILPFLYGLMYIPIWNGNEFTNFNIVTFSFIIIQVICFVFAVINGYYIFGKRKLVSQTIINVLMIISLLLLCFEGIFFIERLMGVPLFPPKN